MGRRYYSIPARFRTEATRFVKVAEGARTLTRIVSAQIQYALRPTRSGDVVESEAVNLAPRSGRFGRRFYS